MFCRRLVAPIKDQRIIAFYPVKLLITLYPAVLTTRRRVFTGIWYLDAVCVHC